MIKKISIPLILVTSLILPHSMMAKKSGYDAALEVAQIQRASKIIDNINIINKHINRYILQTASKPVKNDFTLDNEFFEAYDKSQSIRFDVTDKKVTYKNIAPISMLNMFKNSTSLNSLAVINNNMSMDIALDPSVLLFLKQKSILTTQQPADLTKLWYKPNGNGGFDAYKHDGTNWVLYIKNATAEGVKRDDLIVKTKVELDRIKGTKGDKAYISKEDNSSIQGYLYDGSAWLLESSSSSFKAVKNCTVDDIGVIKYDADGDCMSSCQDDGSDGYAWECTSSIVGGSASAPTSTLLKTGQTT